MVKKILITIFILLSLILSIGAVNGAEITISPSSPTGLDDLTCSVSGSSSETSGRFYFVWSDGETSVNSGSISVSSFTLDSSYTVAGDTWTCYVSKYVGYGWLSFGSASVTISSMGVIGIPYAPEENNCPELDYIENIEVDEGELVTITASASDEDGDALTYSLTEYGDTDFTGANPWEWQTEDGDAGEYAVKVSVTDGECTDYQYVWINVNEISIEENNCPVLESVEDIEVDEGELVTVELIATDEDGDELIYDLYEYANNLVFTESGNVFTWQTEIGDAGSYYIMAYVSDGECSDFDYFYIIVNEITEEVNNCPVLETISDISVDEGELVTITASASDEDGDALTYSISESYGNIAFSGANPWTWQTGEEDDGSYTATVSVSDGECSVSQTVEIIVNEISAEVNNCPVLTYIEDIEADEEDTITISASAIDADGDALSYSLAENYSNISFTGSNPWTWETDESDSGEYVITVTVTDGLCSDSQDVNIEIEDTEEETKGGGAAEKFKVSVSILNPNDLSSNYCLSSEYSGAEVSLSGTYAIEGSCITDTSKDNEIQVYISMQNKLGSDADSLSAFIEIMELGTKTSYSIGTINDGETLSVTIPVSIPNSTATGDYSLQITIQGEDVSQVEYASVHIESAGDAVKFETLFESGVVEQTKGLWERFVNWLANIINRVYNFLF
ncbi:hypothetical protein HZB88_03690 [archaeon]|nr:hypothetical protein [archaeon]